MEMTRQVVKNDNMNTVDEYSQAYTEIYEILKYIPKKDLQKIPNCFIKFIENNMDKNYTYKVEHIKDFENQKMLHKTKVILAILYRDYWATPEKREEIIKKDKEEIVQYENNLREKYDIEKIFIKKHSESKTNTSVKKNNILIVHKENIFKQMLNKVKQYFR